MKKVLKILAGFLCVALTACLFAGCGEEKDTDNNTLKVGIIQYMSHPSLDNCYNGIKAALDASGKTITVDYQIGSASAADSDCTNYAKNMVADGCDLIFAIATPAAKAAYNATADTDIPVIFCAVSDPVAAELVESNDKPGDLCTGTSDVLDLSAQVDLITAMQPEVKTIGVLYTSSEDNSVSNLAVFKEVCAERGLTVEASAVQTAADIPAAADALAAKVDCINNFTDNNVVNNLSVLLSAADKYGIPVYGSEEEQVKNGCLASVSIDYLALGRETGEMGLEVLDGKDAAAMAVRTISDATPVINSDVLASLSVELPAEYADAATVTTE